MIGNEIKRIVFLDWTRVLACFLVMVVHSSEYFYIANGMEGTEGPVSYLTTEADRLWVSIYDGVGRMSVPLFMIISAYLLVPLRRDESTRVFYRRRFGRVIPPMLVFMLLYCFLPLLWGGTSLPIAINDLWHIPFNFPSYAGHLWFMYPLISLYLFIPVLSPWLRKATPGEERFFIILFAISTCMPWLNRWIGELWGQCYWNMYHMLWYFSGFLGFTVLAHYIRVYVRWGTGRRMAVGAALFLVGAVLTIVSFYVQAVPLRVHVTPVIETGWTFCVINCVLTTTGAFLMLSCIKSTNTPRLILELSKLSYGMYLAHIFWLTLSAYVIKDRLCLPSVAAIPLMAAMTFVCSYLSVKIISLIPHTKWITG